MAEMVKHHFTPLLGREVNDFRSLATQVDELLADGQPLHSAARHGVAQAVLDAITKAHHVTLAEVVRDEYNTGSNLSPSQPSRSRETTATPMSTRWSAKRWTFFPTVWSRTS